MSSSRAGSRLYRDCIGCQSPLLDIPLGVVALCQSDGDIPIVGDGWVVGIQSGSLVEVLDCAVVFTELDAGHAPLVVGLGVVRVKLYGPAEVLNRSAVPAEVAQCAPPGAVYDGIVGFKAAEPVEVMHGLVRLPNSR